MALCYSPSNVATRSDAQRRRTVTTPPGNKCKRRGKGTFACPIQNRPGPSGVSGPGPWTGGPAPKGPRSAIGGVVVQWVQRAGTPRRAEGPSRPALRAGHRRRPARHHVTRRRRSRAGAAPSGRNRSCCTPQPRLQFGGVRQPRSQTRLDGVLATGRPASTPGHGNLRVVIGMKVVAVLDVDRPVHTGGDHRSRPGVRRRRHQAAEPQDPRLQLGWHPVPAIAQMVMWVDGGQRAGWHARGRGGCGISYLENSLPNSHGR